MKEADCAPARVALFKRTGSCLTRGEQQLVPDPAVLSTALRPKKPPSWRSNPREWLSTTEINAAMRQYTHQYRRFVYLGAHPRDIGVRGSSSTCLPGAPELLCDFDLRAFLDSGKQELAAVFNLDTRYQRGSHWVALYACFNVRYKTYGACYFDSTGAPPPADDIGRFLTLLSAQAERMGLTGWRVHVNSQVMQKKNTECGVFAMKFIVLCLQNRRRAYEAIVAKVGEDDEVWKFRRVLFRAG